MPPPHPHPFMQMQANQHKQTHQLVVQVNFTPAKKTNVEKKENAAYLFMLRNWSLRRDQCSTANFS